MYEIISESIREIQMAKLTYSGAGLENEQRQEKELNTLNFITVSFPPDLHILLNLESTYLTTNSANWLLYWLFASK